MRIRLLLMAFIAVVAVCPLGSGALTERQDTTTRQQSTSKQQPKTVVIELFTSEGCSTCPPADMLLTALDQKQPIPGVQIIALSEHVDYWNQLGWYDPFSSADFSERQRGYAHALRDKRGVFTPELIVDGHIQLVPSQPQTVVDTIAAAANAPKADVSIKITNLAPKSLTVSVQIEKVLSVSQEDTPEVILAVTESELTSSVARGENAGRKLTHSAVVRKLIKLGQVDGNSFVQERTIELQSKWKQPNMKVVAFAQERNSRRVIGAAGANLREFAFATTASAPRQK